MARFFFAASTLRSNAFVARNAADFPTAPQCPKCGIPLVLRTGPRGNFFGCSHFPKSRETVQMA